MCFWYKKISPRWWTLQPPFPTWTCNWGTSRKGWGWKQRISLGNCVGRKSNTTFNVNPIDKIELDETCSTTSHGNWESTIDMYLKFEIAWIIEYMKVHLDDRLTGHHCLNISASLLWGWELNITLYSLCPMKWNPAWWPSIYSKILAFLTCCVLCI